MQARSAGVPKGEGAREYNSPVWLCKNISPNQILCRFDDYISALTALEMLEELLERLGWGFQGGGTGEITYFKRPKSITARILDDNSLFVEVEEI